MMMNTAAAYAAVRWPPSLKELLIQHLQCVESYEACTIPPFGDGKRSSYNVLRELVDHLNSNHFTTPEAREMNEVIFAFLLQVMEDSCHKSFLKVKEREKLKATYGRKTAHPGIVRRKKAEVEDTLTLDSEKSTFALQLPAEYLLRLFAATPLMIQSFLHYCGGGSFDRTLLKDLWERIEVMLMELDTMNVFYIPSTEYQPAP